MDKQSATDFIKNKIPYLKLDNEQKQNTFIQPESQEKSIKQKKQNIEYFMYKS